LLKIDAGPAETAHPRDSGKHRGIQAPFEIGTVPDPVIEAIADEYGPDAQRQPEDSARDSRTICPFPDGVLAAARPGQS